MTTELPDTEAALLAASVDASPNIKTPKKNQTTHCLSCGAATPQAFCGECGLKNDDLRRSLFRLIGETLGSIFSFEGRMWRTWAALIFKPGKVAREYADGRRTTYSAPIRVYLVMTFLLLGYLAVTQTNLYAVVVTPKTPEQIAAQELVKAQEKAQEEATLEAEIPTQREKIEDSVQSVIDAAKSNDDDALDIALEDLDDANFHLDLDNYNFEFLFFQPQSKFNAMTDKASAEGLVEGIRNDKAAEATGIDGERLDIRKALKIFLTNPIQFNQQFNIWLPRAMFLMVPMVMFFSVIYIRGPNALLYDHLIHAIYIHSIFFMALLIAILLSKIINGATIAKFLFVLLLIYLPISLKRMFGRGWIKTIWTTANIGFIYLIMLTIVMSVITAFSVQKLAA